MKKITLAAFIFNYTPTLLSVNNWIENISLKAGKKDDNMY